MNLFCWTILIAYTAENLSDIFKHKYSMYVLIKSLPRLLFMASKSVFSFQVNDFCSCKCTYGSLLHTQSLANASYCLSVPCILLKTIELNLLYDWFLYCESIPLFSIYLLPFLYLPVWKVMGNMSSGGFSRLSSNPQTYSPFLLVYRRKVRSWYWKTRAEDCRSASLRWEKICVTGLIGFRDSIMGPLAIP